MVSVDVKPNVSFFGPLGTNITKLELVSQLVPPAQSTAKGLQWSWEETSIYLLLIPHKSHETAKFLQNPQN